MAQTLKPEVEARILTAGAHVFARDGYKGAKMSAIARAAGMSTGNLYRYFQNKDALFEYVLGVEFVEAFERALTERVRLLAATDLRHPSAEVRRGGEDFLRFLIDNRLRVVILLDRAGGSAFEGYDRHFVEALMQHSLPGLESELGRGPIGEDGRLILELAFEGSRRALVQILEKHQDAHDIARAFEGFWAFQISGLAGLKEWLGQR